VLEANESVIQRFSLPLFATLIRSVQTLYPVCPFWREDAVIILSDVIISRQFLCELDINLRIDVRNVPMWAL